MMRPPDSATHALRVALRVALRALFASKTAHSVAQVIGARSSQVEGFAVKPPEHSQNPEAPEGT